MRKSIKIETLKYPVFLGGALWEELEAFLDDHRSGGRVFLLMDENTLLHCFPMLAENIPSLRNMPYFVLEPGEKSKNTDSLTRVWSWLMQEQMSKKDLLLNLGGGVVSDLGGYAAATFKRGIHYLNLPTSLISQADAAIGGKTGVNFKGVKNLLGVFHEPQAVFIMTDFLKTLQFRHLRNGMAEIIKCSFLEGPDTWEKMQHLANKWQENLYDLLPASVRFKCSVVAIDPFDHGRRQMLNFGHTIGHGLEDLPLQAGPQGLLHGEAVAAGLICESFMAMELGLMDKICLQSMTDVIRSVFDLPPLKPEKYETVMQRMNLDKKNENGKILFSLAEKPGKPALGVPLDRKQILKAFDYYNSLHSS